MSEDNDMDDICNSFSKSVGTTEGEEIDIIDEIIDILMGPMTPVDRREYMNHVSFTMNRYYYAFIKDILNNESKSKSCEYIYEIRYSSKKFIEMWTFFTQNESKSSPKDLVAVKDAALDSFRWIKKSVDKLDCDSDYSDSPSDS
jgi:hypothetical protein